MGVKVISQNTEERQEETKQLFQKCKPFLDNGDCLSTAVKKAKNINYNGFMNRKWYKELMAYAVSQGYQKRR